MAPDVSPASPELTPAEANRLFYAENAELYDSTEACANSGHARARLETALGHATSQLSTEARVLDAGGGSGNASSILTGRGFDPLVVDVSPEMTAIWEQKARRLGIEPRTQISTLEEFFATDDREWDLIVFSSVLHHLENPIQLLLAAASRLAPNGFIVTVFDPLELGRRGLLLRKVDYLLWLLVHSPARLPMRFWARMRSATGSAEHDNIGEVAELHAERGLDDEAIIEALRGAGATVVSQQRTYDARFAITRALARVLRMPTAFSLALRGPSQVQDPSAA